MTVRLHLETVLPVPPGVAFDLARDLDAHLASMRSSGERIVAGRTGGLIGAGEFVAWRARHLGLPFTLMSRITAFEEGEMFVDEEIAGPFRSLRHEHRFSGHPDGCLMTDHIVFQAPFGPMGRVAERFVLERYMRELIEERNRHLVGAARESRSFLSGTSAQP
ncbi:SRPBCC family protein [Labedella endophytica]|uniref:Cyclase n=1 Tax=Labedella endophytica TaxID=1523160 RepID=A0A3S0XLL3_9MICO|nr:SRPBCC family protein [Labedella endophytica]RUQ99220.1 cyclase [Labedella endophytica]